MNPMMMMMNPMMGMGMSMMGMGMPMMGMNPGVMPGMPGQGMYNAMPGRFGRDMLGRDFAGPGGVGSSQPYRPPDPSALPPMPYGLPFIARPGQEGFDQHGRMIPPELPEGFDGWGRPIMGSGTQAQVAPQPAPMPAAFPEAGQSGGPGMPVGTRDMPFSGTPGSGGSNASYGPRGQVPTLTGGTGSNSTGRPEQPACFERPPARADAYFGYNEFEAFCLPAASLNRPKELHLPRELVGHDVSEVDWARFIEDLCSEALRSAYHTTNRGVNAPGFGRGPSPLLSDRVHTLLASWAVAFFNPRGIKLYAVQDGRKAIPPPIEPPSLRHQYAAASDYSTDTESEADPDDLFEEHENKRKDIYLPRLERDLRKRERARERRRSKRARRKGEVMRERDGEWEVHFVCMNPTIWQPGARPRTYGEPVMRLKRQY